MKKFVLLLLLFPMLSVAQQGKQKRYPASEDTAVFMVAEIMPQFRGGYDSLYAYLGKSIKYPKWEKENNITGTVYTGFVIEPDGSIDNIIILKSVEGSKNFDAEALRVIQSMPKWVPGVRREHRVRVQYHLPIDFSLTRMKPKKKKKKTK